MLHGSAPTEVSSQNIVQEQQEIDLDVARRPESVAHDQGGPDSSSYLQLPVEVMRLAYGPFPKSSSGGSGHYRDLTLLKTESGYRTVLETDQQEVLGFLLVSKAHNDSFSACLDQRIPVHIQLSSQLSPVSDGSLELNIRNLANMLPAFSRKLFVRTKIHNFQHSFDSSQDGSTFEWGGDAVTPWPADSLSAEDVQANEVFTQSLAEHLVRKDTEEMDLVVPATCEGFALPVQATILFDVTTSPAFTEFKKRLKGCNDTEDIYLTINNAEGDALPDEQDSNGELESKNFKDIESNALVKSNTTLFEELPLELLEQIYPHIGWPLRRINHLKYDAVIVITKTPGGHDKIVTAAFEDLAKSLSLSTLLHDRLGEAYPSLDDTLPLLNYSKVNCGHSKIELGSTIYSRGVFLSSECAATSFSLDTIEPKEDCVDSMEEFAPFEWVEITNCKDVEEGGQWPIVFESNEPFVSAQTPELFTAADISIAGNYPLQNMLFSLLMMTSTLL
ncbi:hypothetical protein CERZMDRAFT_92496 [Cercospora zeae-maydis SCOH1-5]|uniref:Uncharacterized protein n=1 Tax=Cercospora zeae-maydis SCOH1-5 TaxID=717836 RepID=A0A6A6FWS0_9PEZI|nr:hypothetical protein CERZMDRAFT_92496 [Cercospora zeae-maydis SCOH1-5]